jgi:hypothetical protein
MERGGKCSIIGVMTGVRLYCTIKFIVLCGSKKISNQYTSGRQAQFKIFQTGTLLNTIYPQNGIKKIPI